MSVLLLLSFVVIFPILQRYIQGRGFRRLVKSLFSLYGQLEPVKAFVINTAFFEVDSATPSFTCIASTKERRCMKQLSKEQRIRARDLKRALAFSPPSHQEAFAALLKEYARTCLCRHFHCKPDYLTAAFDTWSSKLTEIFDSLTTEHEPSTLRIPGGFDLSEPVTSEHAKPEHLDSAESLHATPNTQIDKWRALFGIGRVCSAELDSEDDESTDIAWRFEHFSRKSRKSFEDLIHAPLGPSDRESGYLYAFTREGDEDYIKIGFSKKLDSRPQQWSKDCKYDAIVIPHSRATNVVPNANRVEKLIHMDLELQSARRRESKCRTNPECKRRHREWFEVSDTKARSVIEYWIDWMITNDPYDRDGHLKVRCVLAMYLPGAGGEPCRFTSDSSGKSWMGAGNNISTAYAREDTETNLNEITQPLNTIVNDGRVTIRRSASPKTPSQTTGDCYTVEARVG